MVQRHNGYSGSQLFVINSQPVAINALEKLSIGRGHFGVLAGMSKFDSIIVHRKTICKGQRIQLKISFVFRQVQLI